MGDHFVGITEMVGIGSGAQRAVEDWALSRYACYLVIQNADPSKPLVALCNSCPRSGGLGVFPGPIGIPAPKSTDVPNGCNLKPLPPKTPEKALYVVSPQRW